MEDENLIYGFILNGKGGATRINWQDIQDWKPKKGVLWLHLDYSTEDTKNWILNKSGLDEVSSEALLTEESRPRTIVIENAALISLRGVNLNPGSDPEDMVSIRLWVDKNRVISTRKRPLLSIPDIAAALEKGNGPKTTGDFVVELTDRLINRMQGTIETIEDRLAQIEENIIDSSNPGLRNQLLEIRREAILLRRYLAPQREALMKLHSENLSWMNQADKIHIREVNDNLIRYLEDLDSTRDRAAVTQEELNNQLSEQMNKRMYVLSLVAAIFLPLGFLTGLLGINVGGIPGAENNWAFFLFVGMLGIVVFIQLLLFKKMKWM